MFRQAAHITIRRPFCRAALQVAEPCVLPQWNGNNLAIVVRRTFHASGIIYKNKTVPIIYIEPNDEEKEVQAEIGKNLLDIAHDNNIELEGACGGELACATCHLIFEKEIYDTLPPKEDEEDDMLDLAFELTETSRLGCQICVREDMAGMKVRIPHDGF